MPTNLPKLNKWRRPSTKWFNDLVDRVNMLSNIHVRRGSNPRVSVGPHGVNISVGGGSAAGSQCYIAEVDSDATGGGYYNCHLQTLGTGHWNTQDADQVDDTGGSVVILNLSEIPESGQTTNHNLAAGDKMICWQITDDGGNTRYVGFGCLRPQKINIVSNIQVSGTTLQDKSYTSVIVYGEGTLTESGWTTWHTGTECA